MMETKAKFSLSYRKNKAPWFESGHVDDVNVIIF